MEVKGAGTSLLLGAIEAAKGGMEEGDIPIQPGPNFDSTFALHQPELYFKYKKKEAKILEIDPPASPDLQDMLEYEARATKRREEYTAGKDWQGRNLGPGPTPGPKKPWGI